MYYVIDTTIKNDQGQHLVASYNTVKEVVAHLQVMCPKLTGKNRFELMSDAADLGFGDDDVFGKNFTNMMIEHNVNIGVIRDDGQPIRCDIHDDNQFSNKTEYGH